MSGNDDHGDGVLYGGPDVPLIEADCRSLGEVVLRKLAESKDSELVIDSITGGTLRAHELRSQSIRLAQCLRADGVTIGDVIGLSSENGLAFPVVLYAGVLLGATVAPLNTSYTTDELQHALQLSRPRIVFASGHTLQRVCQAAGRSTFVQQIITLDGSETAPKVRRSLSVQSIRRFVDRRPNGTATPPTTTDADAAFRCTPVDMHDNVVLVLCSSGTTGLPKGVQLTQFNLHSAISGMCEGIALMAAMGMPDATTLSVIPWFHAYGLLTLIGMSVGGRRLVTMARYTVQDFLSALSKYRCDALFGVPPLLLMLAKHPLVTAHDLSHLKIVYSGAAPLSREVADAVQARVPSVLGVFQGFGMSEMTLSVLQQNPMFCTSGSVGVLRPGIWGKIVDPVTGATLTQRGERGEMCFRGAAIMKGYVGDAMATRDTIDAAGWLHTGDIGYVSADGEWFIVDRLKELIKYKGFQVPPAELEAVLLQHADIVDAGVIGVPDERVGERAMGFVVRRAGARLTAGEVEAFVAERMSHAKRLHGGVRFVREIPKNPSGKILRRELRELLAAKGSKAKL